MQRGRVAQCVSWDFLQSTISPPSALLVVNLPALIEMYPLYRWLIGLESL